MKYLVGNFKNKLNKNDIVKYSNKLNELSFKNTEVIICPSSIYLSFFNGINYKLGVQDISSFIDKTITGEISGEQLKSMGVEYVIVGHSERRTIFAETDEQINEKIKQLIKNKITPLFCIGETLKEYENKETKKVIKKQIEKGLKGINASELNNLIIAYEPVWAIGTGKTADAKTINNITEYIKNLLLKMYGENSKSIKVLYGGSVNSENASNLLTDLVDGALVGGASLNAEKFINIGRNV